MSSVESRALDLKYLNCDLSHLKNMNKQKILIIDPDPRVLSTLVRFLNDESYDISTVRNGIEGLEILRREKIDLTVAEMYMEGLDGVALLRCLKEEKIQTNILIIGSVLLMEITKEILTAGAVSVLDKPIVKDKILAEIKNCIPLNEVGYKVSRVREAPRSLPRSVQRPLNAARVRGFARGVGIIFGGALQKPRLEI